MPIFLTSLMSSSIRDKLRLINSAGDAENQNSNSKTNALCTVGMIWAIILQSLSPHFTMEQCHVPLWF